MKDFVILEDIVVLWDLEGFQDLEAIQDLEAMKDFKAIQDSKALQDIRSFKHYRIQRLQFRWLSRIQRLYRIQGLHRNERLHGILEFKGYQSAAHIGFWPCSKIEAARLLLRRLCGPGGLWMDNGMFGVFLFEMSLNHLIETILFFLSFQMTRIWGQFQLCYFLAYLLISMCIPVSFVSPDFHVLHRGKCQSKSSVCYL